MAVQIVCPNNYSHKVFYAPETDKNYCETCLIEAGWIQNVQSTDASWEITISLGGPDEPDAVDGLIDVLHKTVKDRGWKVISIGGGKIGI